MSTNDSGVETGTESNDSMSIESPRLSENNGSPTNQHEDVDPVVDARDHEDHSIAEDHSNVVKRSTSVVPQISSSSSWLCSSPQMMSNLNPIFRGNNLSDISLAVCCSSLTPQHNHESLFSGSSIAEIESDPPAGLSFSNIHPLPSGYQSLESYAQSDHQCKVKSGRMLIGNRKQSARWRNYNYLYPRIYDILGGRKLRIAANTNNSETVKTLLSTGVNPSSCDEKKRTALHFAACNGYSEIVKVLLDCGADPNLKDIVGNTPLHLAACTSHLDVVTLLLQAGTDVKSIDNSGRTPLQLANSRLKLIQADTIRDSCQLKSEVIKVVEMMQVYLQKSGLSVEADLLNMFSNRLNLRQTRAEVDTDVQELLSSLSHLSLNKSEQR